MNGAEFTDETLTVLLQKNVPHLSTKMKKKISKTENENMRID